MAIYVDDVLIFWRDQRTLDLIKSQLCAAFKMKDLGRVEQCIGLKIEYGGDGIAIHQITYIERVLERFGMTNCKPAPTPCDPSQKLSVTMANSNEMMSDVPYQEAVGSLLYLVQGTRPDIAFAINDVSRFNANHGVAHWIAVKRIMRYLRGTTDFRILYRYGGNPLRGFSDSDWASDIDQRRSCTGYIFMMSDGAVSWSSSRQHTVALSSTEAEFLSHPVTTDCRSMSAGGVADDSVIAGGPGHIALLNFVPRIDRVIKANSHTFLITNISCFI